MISFHTYLQKVLLNRVLSSLLPTSPPEYHYWSYYQCLVHQTVGPWNEPARVSCMRTTDSSLHTRPLATKNKQCFSIEYAGDFFLYNEISDYIFRIAQPVGVGKLRQASNDPKGRLKITRRREFIWVDKASAGASIRSSRVVCNFSRYVQCMLKMTFALRR